MNYHVVGMVAAEAVGRPVQIPLAAVLKPSSRTHSRQIVLRLACTQGLKGWDWLNLIVISITPLAYASSRNSSSNSSSAAAIPAASPALSVAPPPKVVTHTGMFPSSVM